MPGYTYYPWTRYAYYAIGTGMCCVPDGKTYMATIHRKNDPIPSDNPEDYAGLWVKIKGEDGQSPYDVDIISTTSQISLMPTNSSGRKLTQTEALIKRGTIFTQEGLNQSQSQARISTAVPHLTATSWKFKNEREWI